MAQATDIGRKALVRIAGFVLASAVSLFGPAGTLRWWNAWLFLGVAVLLVGSLTGAVFRNTPGLLQERLTARTRSKGWDRFFVPALGGLPLVLNVVAGLDRSQGWTRGIATWASLAALAPMLAGIALTFRAMRANPFFSSHVRIQQDRGQVVVSAGPYAHVRHPGYAGAILYNLATPLLLGSAVALLPGVAMAALLVARTWLEDRTLRAELAGYRDYAGRVRFRLLPHAW